MRPNKAQEQALMKTLIASRQMYNTCLEELITHYKETGKYMHLYEQDKRHGKEAHPDLPAVVVDTTLKRLHRSFTNFFQGRKEGRKVGFPRFKNAPAGLDMGRNLATTLVTTTCNTACKKACPIEQKRIR